MWFPGLLGRVWATGVQDTVGAAGADHITTLRANYNIMVNVPM